MRRDARAEADQQFWSSMDLAAASAAGDRKAAQAAVSLRYQSAVARSMALGFTYLPAEAVAALPVEDIIARIDASVPNGVPRPSTAEALLGSAPDPSEAITVSEAFEVYVEKIAFDDQFNKSDAQRRSWEKTKRTSIGYFIERVGDVPLGSITRELATEYRDWWQDRLRPKDPATKPVTPNTANRHIGNIRSLYLRYHKYVGKPDIVDPFKGFFFAGKSEVKRAAFSDDWVRDRILKPGLFDSLNVELRTIFFLLIETGARLSEIVSLQADDIRLDCEVPHILIRPEQNRELKTSDSRREIPLVGVAERAITSCSHGFPRYYDRSTLVSANLMKAFKTRKLLPTKDHVLYSFRHAFEDRMLEGGLDYGLRCALMGHKNNRPEYGSGGSLAYRRAELLKIAHPFDPAIFRAEVDAQSSVESP
ncbi:tyrosine-type recombinase/integrase [Parvularcula mediterranea]|nr:tyrosine-type recombinase/integrase [Parvularcula mediterranea]